jgi:uncharacterized damage-inducible protein DinB
MTSPLIQALIAHFDSVFTGPNGDYTAVWENIAKMPSSEAFWKPAPSQNSIWKIVEHLIASKEWLIEMIEHGQAPSPVWVEPSGDETDWQAALARLAEAHQRLKQTLGDLTDADLLTVPDAEEGRTLLELILSSGTAHEAHHGGQIDYLKGLRAAS